MRLISASALSAGLDLVEPVDALRLHESAIQMLLVQLVILAQTRGYDLLQVETHIEAQNVRDL